MSVDIRKLSDLTGASVQSMFRAYFGDPDLEACIKGDLAGLGGGANENYNSDIKRLTCVVKRKGEAEELHLVAKLPVPHGFMRQMHKIARPLMKEVTWYTRAAPALLEQAPGLAGTLPICYHGHTGYGERLAPTACERVCCLPCWFPFRKMDDGILLLEDLSKYECCNIISNLSDFFYVLECGVHTVNNYVCNAFD